MTALALDPELTETARAEKSLSGGRPIAPGRRDVRTRPVGKPGNCPAPQLGYGARVRSHACTVGAERAIGVVGAPAARPQTAKWRLTDRGIAAVLTLGLLLTVAALVCIGLRAVEVTSPDHQSGSVVSTVADSAAG